MATVDIRDLDNETIARLHAIKQWADGYAQIFNEPGMARGVTDSLVGHGISFAHAEALARSIRHTTGVLATVTGDLNDNLAKLAGLLQQVDDARRKAMNRNWQHTVNQGR